MPSEMDHLRAEVTASQRDLIHLKQHLMGLLPEHLGKEMKNTTTPAKSDYYQSDAGARLHNTTPPVSVHERSRIVQEDVAKLRNRLHEERCEVISSTREGALLSRTVYCPQSNGLLSNQPQGGVEGVEVDVHGDQGDPVVSFLSSDNGCENLNHMEQLSVENLPAQLCHNLKDEVASEVASELPRVTPSVLIPSFGADPYSVGASVGVGASVCGENPDKHPERHGNAEGGDEDDGEEGALHLPAGIIDNKPSNNVQHHTQTTTTSGQSFTTTSGILPPTSVPFSGSVPQPSGVPGGSVAHGGGATATCTTPSLSSLIGGATGNYSGGTHGMQYHGHGFMATGFGTHSGFGIHSQNGTTPHNMGSVLPSSSEYAASLLEVERIAHTRTKQTLKNWEDAAVTIKPTLEQLFGLFLGSSSGTAISAAGQSHGLGGTSTSGVSGPQDDSAGGHTHNTGQGEPGSQSNNPGDTGPLITGGARFAAQAALASLLGDGDSQSLTPFTLIAALDGLTQALLLWRESGKDQISSLQKEIRNVKASKKEVITRALSSLERKAGKIVELEKKVEELEREKEENAGTFDGGNQNNFEDGNGRNENYSTKNGNPNTNHNGGNQALDHGNQSFSNPSKNIGGANPSKNESISPSKINPTKEKHVDSALSSLQQQIHKLEKRFMSNSNSETQLNTHQLNTQSQPHILNSMNPFADHGNQAIHHRSNNGEQVINPMGHNPMGYGEGEAERDDVVPLQHPGEQRLHNGDPQYSSSGQPNRGVVLHHENVGEGVVLHHENENHHHHQLPGGLITPHPSGVHGTYHQPMKSMNRDEVYHQSDHLGVTSTGTLPQQTHLQTQSHSHPQNQAPHPHTPHGRRSFLSPAREAFLGSNPSSAGAGNSRARSAPRSGISGRRPLYKVDDDGAGGGPISSIGTGTGYQGNQFLGPNQPFQLSSFMPSGGQSGPSAGYTRAVMGGMGGEYPGGRVSKSSYGGNRTASIGRRTQTGSSGHRQAGGSKSSRGSGGGSRSSRGHNAKRLDAGHGHPGVGLAEERFDAGSIYAGYAGVGYV